MFEFFLGVGAISIVISGIYIGAWIDGQQQRANFYSETEEQRNFRTKIGLISGLIGLTSFGLAGLIYYL
ncbi:hypothetical protein D1B33_08105 [Lysinibacillus yapensis]|uniref:Uncharacterized protein n=1 Tax=Ureibacillus yapensis TaxID=2304605 RepID=A0A396S8S6_9BACL|nr:DUF5316 family protein [Lysinibacillus yapensis]RHW37492.1 hypothetical protein D1B33_08105 [Lysinibacillus yapensis]